jgi:hypothetical protein
MVPKTLGSVSLAASGSFLRSRTLGGARADERLECNNWLRTFLAERLTSTMEVFKSGNAAGFSKDQIRRAKYRIGAVARSEGFGGTGQWSRGLHVPASNQ